LLKYGLMQNRKLPYTYLAQYENGFVYFKGDKLIEELKELFYKGNNEDELID